MKRTKAARKAILDGARERLTDTTSNDPGPWRNRIVGYGEMDPAQILAHPDNWRVHSKKQREMLRGQLAETGWLTAVIINRTTGHLIDGHMRVEEALKAEAKVPVTFVELSIAEERRVLATLDAITAYANPDQQKLDELIEQVTTADEPTRRLLEELRTQEGDGDGESGTVAFTEILGEENNYVVLVFRTASDWLFGQDVFGLETVKATHARPGYEAKGVGRVLDGVKAIARIRGEA